MDRDKVKELAKDKKYISGIYNYCDRWCERCPQTSRCLNYVICEDEFSDPETRDIRNEAFWKKMSEILLTTTDMLHEMAASMQIDLDDIDIDNNDKMFPEEESEDHEVCMMAKDYADMVTEWIDGAEDLIDSPRYELSSGDDAGDGSSLNDAMDVIQWYQPQIYVKLVRAVSGLMEEADSFNADDQYASDSDGSAKVALIGIDRSIAAWGCLNRIFPGFYNNNIKNILTHLDRLRKKVEMTFPDARKFIRPGFDAFDLNS